MIRQLTRVAGFALAALVFAGCTQTKEPSVATAADQNALLGGLTDDYPDDRLRNAWIACRHLYPSITYRKVDAAQAKEYRNYGLCMREHGMIEGVPWVEEDGTIADKNNSATRVGPDPGPSPEYMAAHRLCRKHLSGGQGDPPPQDLQ